MNLALVGWDIDEGVTDALARWGISVLAYTRWFPHLPHREIRGGVTLVRCPHRIEGGIRAESFSFRDAVLEHAAEDVRGGEVAVVLAFDALARPAALGLRDFWPSSVLVAALTLEDLDGDLGPGSTAAVDRWVCPHPWVSHAWRARHPDDPRPIAVIPSREEGILPAGPATEGEDGPGPVWVIEAAHGEAFDPHVVVEALAEARRTVPGLRAVVLGAGPLAEALRQRLERRRWLAGPAATSVDLTLERWQSWMSNASVVGVAAPSLADDATARIAWLRRVPAVRIDVHDSRTLADALRDALYVPTRREATVTTGVTLARRGLEPASIAEAWLRVSLEALTAPGSGGTDAMAAATPSAPDCRRSRVAVVAVGPRQAYASWSLLASDWSTALEWLGPDAVRAAPVLRVSDVTDLAFHGGNAQATWDVGLGFDETHRVIHLDQPGRSLAVRFGVRSPRGDFHPLAHARICHLPREGHAPTGPVRRLRVMPRRDA